MGCGFHSVILRTVSPSWLDWSLRRTQYTPFAVFVFVWVCVGGGVCVCSIFPWIPHSSPQVLQPHRKLQFSPDLWCLKVSVPHCPCSYTARGTAFFKLISPNWDFTILAFTLRCSLPQGSFPIKHPRLLVLLSTSSILLQNSCCQPWEAQHHPLYPPPVGDAQPRTEAEAIPLLRWLGGGADTSQPPCTEHNCFSTPHRGQERAHSPSDRISGQDAELKGCQWPWQEPATYPPILQECNQAPTCGWQLHKTKLHVSFSKTSSHCHEKILAQWDSQGSHCTAKRDRCRTQARSFLFSMYLEIMIAWLLTPRLSQLPLPAEVACSPVLEKY